MFHNAAATTVFLNAPGALTFIKRKYKDLRKQKEIQRPKKTEGLSSEVDKSKTQEPKETAKHY
jgi:hypothetical protein